MNEEMGLSRKVEYIYNTHDEAFMRRFAAKAIALWFKTGSEIFADILDVLEGLRATESTKSATLVQVYDLDEER